MHSVTLVLKIILWWMEFENMDGCEHTSAIENNKLKALVEANPHTTDWKLSGELGSNIEMISEHLNWIGLLKKLNI